MSDNILSKLNTLYTEADSADKAIFAEQRSNCLLYIGQHYQKQDSALGSFIRGAKNIPQEKKLRLTKNHIGAICDRLINSTVTGQNPSVSIQARHKMEIQDKKAADIASGVWSRIKAHNKIEDQVAEFAFDFVVHGEMAAFVHFDQTKGDYLGMADVIDGDTNEVIDKKPKFSGEIITRRLESFNLLRDPTAKSWHTSPYVIYREMAELEHLKLIVDDPEKVSKLNTSADETFVVFDAQKGSYTQSGKDKVLVKHIFYRQCEKYPEGYYYLYSSDVIIAEGTLNGVFPIVFRPYSSVTTSPRGYSIIKRLRPCQAEINRIASTIAMSQVYFRDRMILLNGTKIANAGTMAGAVMMRVNGTSPQIQQGQSGEKYLPMLDNQISEMYQLALLQQEEEEKVSNTDAMAMLYRSSKEKKKFSQKSAVFDSFLREICEVALETAKLFYTDEHLVPSVDRKDYINIEEFKNITKMDYSVEVKSGTADIESTLGQQLAIQHAIQYSQNLSPEQSAILMANMPYLKDSDIAQEITADYRAKEDVFASIERGQAVEVLNYDNHKYFIKCISNRMKESSFRFLDPMIQQIYRDRLAQHEQIEADNAEKVRRAQSGFIPAGGALIPVQLYMDPKNASKRIRLPHDALVDLYKKLNEQGSLQADLQSQIGNEGALAEMSAMMPEQPQDQTHASMPQPGQGDFNGY